VLTFFIITSLAYFLSIQVDGKPNVISPMLALGNATAFGTRRHTVVTRRRTPLFMPLAFCIQMLVQIVQNGHQ
tara:strand:- start:47 stop:265 length:219 start_codon:yes stop_codon:yes gene_type:complete